MIAMRKVFAKIWKILKEVLRISWLNLQTNLHITKKKALYDCFPKDKEDRQGLIFEIHSLLSFFRAFAIHYQKCIAPVTLRQSLFKVINGFVHRQVGYIGRRCDT